MSIDHLRPLDETFLHVEDDVSHMHIGSVGIFEGPPPSHEKLLTALEGKLDRAPRFRQRARAVPLDAGRPVWVDDPDFDLRYHVRRTAVPAPGEDAELSRLVGRIMSNQLDLERPLWEMWAVEGLAGGRWALISKVHHSVVDGIAGSHLILGMMDTERDPAPAAQAPWIPAPEPGGTTLVLDAVADRTKVALRELRAATSALRHPRQEAARVGDVLRGLAAYAGITRAPEPCSLNGPIGSARRWTCARATLADVRTIRTGLGGTVNDVVLAAITGGFRDLLQSRGESTDRVVRSLVPISVRARDEHGVHDNRVSALFGELPVSVADPVGRLEAVKAEMRRLKESHEADAGELLLTLAELVPELLFDFSERLASRLPQHFVNTVTTNVPGPQMPFYLCGRRMLEALPYVPLAGHVRVGVAIYSYDGNLGFGVTGDFDTAPDIGVLSDGIERGIAELLAAAA